MKQSIFIKATEICFTENSIIYKFAFPFESDVNISTVNTIKNMDLFLKSTHIPAGTNEIIFGTNQNLPLFYDRPIDVFSNKFKYIYKIGDVIAVTT